MLRVALHILRFQQVRDQLDLSLMKTQTYQTMNQKWMRAGLVLFGNTQFWHHSVTS